MDVIYEVKFEVGKDQEQKIVRELNLDFRKEYKDIDIYLKTDDSDAIKIKALGDEFIFYRIKFVDGIFEIVGKTINSKAAEVLKSVHPVEIKVHRIKRAYEWKKNKVRCGFDYLEEFPNRLFFEIHHSSRKSIERVRSELVNKGFSNLVTLPFSKLTFTG